MNKTNEHILTQEQFFNVFKKLGLSESDLESIQGKEGCVSTINTGTPLFKQVKSELITSQFKKILSKCGVSYVY